MNPITLLSIVVVWLAWRELKRSGTPAAVVASPKSIAIGNIGNTVNLDGVFTNKVWVWQGDDMEVVKTVSGLAVARFALVSGVTMFIGEGRWETKHPHCLASQMVNPGGVDPISGNISPYGPILTNTSVDPNDPSNWILVDTSDAGLAKVYDPSGISLNSAGQLWD